jgi:hypothetical protein
MNPETRSDASQQIRAPGDAFFADVAVVGTWQHFWGRAGGEVRSQFDINTLVRNFFNR